MADNGAAGLAEQTAAYTNACHSVGGWVHSTAHRTHGLRFLDLGGETPRGIGEEFLVATRFRAADRATEQSIQGYFLDPGVVMLSRNGQQDLAGLTTVPLPRGVRLRRDLGEVLGNRRSVREYTGDAAPFDQVATLLRAGGAVTATGRVDLTTGGHRDIDFRVAPSPGGTYPLDTYLLAVRVNGLAPGVWRYDNRRDLLVAEGDPTMLDAALAAFAVPEEIISLSRCAAVLVLAARPWKVMRKYGDRGIRYLFIEAGAVAENIHLACGSLGLGSVDCASVHDDELHDALGFDGELRFVAHTIVIGVPA